MKTWYIPVTWEVFSVITVEAETLEEAMEIARDDDGKIPCPAYPDYVDGSWRIEEDEDMIRALYNDDQEDE